MAEFLNSSELREWIPRLINETERELVIIVPFIKTSRLLYESLENANKRGVETTIVYRENTLPFEERKKLMALDNLNLLYHPNVHAKCYLNEKYLIVTSMNLYEYSEKNNREMGVLLFDHAAENRGGALNGKDLEAIENGRGEINAVINSATMEKKSLETISEGFEMEIIKTKLDKAHEFCQVLNKIFENKRFKVDNLHNAAICKCEDYYDKIDVYFDNNRIEFVLKPGQDAVQKIHERFKPAYNEFQFKYFKFYWNHPRQSIYLYPNTKLEIWNNRSMEETLMLKKQGINDVILYVKRFF